MKSNLFLSAVSLFAVLHLCKAGPLRIQKRAAFYIANETACVVDNIVYSNGDPIPTDDPCEACKCRPPGFACVLKECKAKPGCKAVRRVGQCCPEYVCDVPERNQFIAGNNLPPVNLLTALLPADFPTVSRTQKPSETPLEPTQPPTPSNTNEETLETDSKESTELTSGPKTTDSANPEIEDSTLAPETNEEKVRTSNEDKDEGLSKDKIDDKEHVEVNEETKPLFNSETELKKEDIGNLTPVKIDPTQSSAEEIKEEEPQTTVSNELVENESEEPLTESPEKQPVSTTIPESEKQIKNSAAENGKSLKLSDEPLKDSQKNGDSIIVDKVEKTAEKLDETVTETQLGTETQSGTSTDSEPVPEETRTKADATSNNSSDKIKSESAETVTIVVHVKEKTKSTEEVTPKSETSTTQFKLLKSNDKLRNIEVTEEYTTTGIVPTDKNFEIFAEEKLVESTSISPLTEQPKEKIEDTSETDSTTVSPITERKLVDLRNDEDTTPVTTDRSFDDVTKVNKGVETNAVEKNKESDPTVTEMKINPNVPLNIEIITDFLETPEIKQSRNESKNEETEETTTKEIAEGKPEVQDPETKEKKEEVEINVEAREEEAGSDVKLEETTPEIKLEETISDIKSEETTPEVKVEISTEMVKKSTSTEKFEETTIEKGTSQVEKLEVTTPAERVKESKSAEKLVEAPPSEKVTEYPSTEKSEVTTTKENIEKTTPTEKAKESTTETNKMLDEKIQETESNETTEKTAEDKNESDKTTEHKIQGNVD